MKLPKRPANKAEKIIDVISENLKKRVNETPKKGVDLTALAKKLGERKEEITKKNNEDENKDED